MNKDVKYNGYSAQPSDYECQDGDLASSLNLINEDGAIRPVLKPSVLLHLDPPLEPVIIHKTSEFTHFILLNPETKFTYWLDSESINSNGIPQTGSIKLLGLFEDTDIYDFNCIGNVVITATSDGMNYFLWNADEENYKDLGTHIPPIDIEMALSLKDYTDTESGSPFSFSMDDNNSKYINAVNRLLSLTDGARGTYRPADAETRSALEFVSNAVIGALNKYMAEQNADNLFLQPFFVRYSYRLFDGSNTMPSAPILMIPNSYEPIIKVNKLENKNNTLDCQCSIFYTPARLVYRILSDTTRLADWKDIITHIDFFVTPQIYTFDQSKDLTVLHRTSEANKYKKFSHIGVFTTSTTRGEGSFGDHRHNDPSSPLNSYLIPKANIEKTETVSSTGSFWHVTSRPKKDIESDITSSQLFYKVASIDFEDIVKMNNFAKVEVESLSSLPTLPRLIDDFHTHHTFIPKALYPYNSRLSIANMTIEAFSGFPIRSMCQFTYKGTDSNFQPIDIYVRLKSSDKSRWIKLERNSSYLSLDKSPYAYDSIAENFPRWLFYPDSTATEIIIATDNGYWRLPLTRHDFINGTYWFRGLSSDTPEMTSGAVPDEIRLATDNKIPFQNRVCTSEVNNPFYFPVTGIVAVGTGEISAICTAARPLSQGQFGQFPLYAFSSEGVWAMEVSSQGTYSARQPITRDVCINKEGITQIDSAVIFPTDRGIMLISGSQVSCISQNIDSDYPFQSSTLKSLESVSPALQSAPEIMPFKEFLTHCRMAYDYVNQRIYIYSPLEKYPYTYVYSLKSGMWGLMTESFQSTLNSYPEAYVVSSDSAVVNLSDPQDLSSVNALLVSRPVKLDAPDIHKTIDSVIQRGYFRKGHVQSVLYGSRDLFTWHVVWSSKDHFLRGFSGSPYKYFRIALICNLAPDESIHGASVQFTPRLTNRPR